MKKSILLLAVLLLTTIATWAQGVPQALNYQAVARDAAGTILANQAIRLKINILQGGAFGPVQYSETHSATTNQFGLFALKVGRGTPVTGTFSSVPWTQADQWLQVEMDPAGGNNFFLMGSSELISVPYALYAERVGIVNLALNMYSQGVHPNLDFSDIDDIKKTVEYCNQIAVHPRHPYAGDLVYTSFSGSHQDAIKKGFAVQPPDGLWQVPYLPIDPADVGRSYDSVIRVNSQSGKGGIAYLLESEYGVVLPRRLQVEFSRVVQAHTDNHGGEMSAAEIWQLFARTYLDNDQPVRYVEHHLFEHGSAQGIRLSVEIDGRVHLLAGEGNGPIDAAVHALRHLGVAVQVRSYEERSLAARGKGSDASACAFLELMRPGSGGESYGVGIDENIVTASIRSLVNGINRLESRAAAGSESRAA